MVSSTCSENNTTAIEAKSNGTSNNEMHEVATVLTTLGSTQEISESDHKQQICLERHQAIETEDEEKFEIPQRFTKSGRKRAVSFPLKLMKVLSDEKFSHIVTWMPSGKAFSIVKPKAFEVEILPDDFKSAKYSSFTRKLHRWGFMKCHKGDETGAYYHKDFQKDRLDLAEKMTCIKSSEPIDSNGATVNFVDTHAPSAASPAVVVPPLGAEQLSNLSRMSVPSFADVAPSTMPKASAIAPLPAFDSAFFSHLLTQRRLSVPVPKHPSQSQDHYCRHQPQPLVLGVQECNNQRSMVETLNAAIQLECSRRLQEQFKAAVRMSRISQEAAVVNRLLPLSMTQPNVCFNRFSTTSTTASLRIELLQLQQQKEQMQYLSLLGMAPITSQGLDQMPMTNIQGAKTA